MENDHSCKIEDMGSIRIPMFDGKTLRLTNVRHIFCIRNNLISVGEVDMRGFHWKVIDRILTVERGSTVIMKAYKRKNLYILEASTILGEANATMSLEHET